MTSSKRTFAIIVALLLTGCGPLRMDSDLTTSSQPASSVSLPPLSGPNVMPITVNGALCSADSYSNKPCVSVTVCSPDGSHCQTVTDILLDTGSYGFRVFKSALSPALQNALTPSMRPLAGGSSVEIAECVQFGDGSSEWGPIALAGIGLGEEPLVQSPIQIIDSTYETKPAQCSQSDANPSAAGFNGILGVGLFPQDCGPDCANFADNQLYYGCRGGTCSGIAVPVADQVANPVALLPLDHNGVVVQLPAVPIGGVGSANGYLVLGIGTQPNNTPSGVTAYSANAFGEFETTFEGITYSSYLDTGSNALYFSSSSIPQCGTYGAFDFSDWLCPSSTVNLIATNRSADGVQSSQMTFPLGNAIQAGLSGNQVFVELGAVGDGFSFDWGLPFFFGKSVYIGIDSESTGPYWAYSSTSND